MAIGGTRLRGRKFLIEKPGLSGNDLRRAAFGVLSSGSHLNVYRRFVTSDRSLSNGRVVDVGIGGNGRSPKN